MSESASEEYGPRQRFEESLVAAIDALLNDPDMTPVAFSVDLQASQQHPYRVTTTEELYPVVGEVRTEVAPDPEPGNNTDGAETETEDQQ